VTNLINSEAAGRLRRVEGRHNPLVKELRQAFTRGELTDGGECAIDGFRIIEEAVRSGLKFRAVFFSESAEARAGKLLPQIHSHVETLLLPDKLFASAVPSQTPQGAAALVHMKKFTLEDILGASGILLGESTVSVYNSKVVRASAGSVFRLPIAKVELKPLAVELRSRAVRLLATSSHKGVPLPQANLTGRTAILIGNEGAGIDKRMLSNMDELILIPHSPRVESLNAGVAASIVLYEAARQKLNH
jgi:TrmH family RNA methyltransferase